MSQTTTPKAFVWRRLHSLMGLWLVLFLFMHLLANSQAALMIGEDGKGFIHDVEFIHSLPYLKVIELTLLALPFGIHIIWGVQYLLTGQYNSMRGDGTRPHLSYERNHAYTWQRITAWILLFAVIAHVVQMRFMLYPTEAKVGNEEVYLTKLTLDSGLYTLSDRLGVNLLSQKDVESKLMNAPDTEIDLNRLLGDGTEEAFIPERQQALLAAQTLKKHSAYLEKLSQFKLAPNEVIASCPNFGTATLLMVRDTFKSPFMVAMYSLFVLAAVYHAFNGLWTGLITWGITLTPRSQQLMLVAVVGLMLLVSFLGLTAAIGTYWINLKY